MLSSNPAVNLIKTMGSSSKFLAAAVLYSVMVVFVILGSLNTGNLVNQLYYYGANYGMVDPDVFYTLMYFLDGSLVGWAVIGSIPSILIAVGMWLFYVSSRNTRSGNVSTAGLTICKVLAIISLVMICVAVAISLCILVIFMAVLGSNMSAATYYGYEGVSALVAVQVILGIVAVILAALVVLYILFYVSAVKVINRIKNSAINGVPDNRIPRFLTGFLMFLGVMGVLGGLITMVTNPLSGIASLASAVCFILLSMLLREYRNKMTMLLYPPVQPVYGTMPPYQNPPQQPGNPNGNMPQ